MIEARATATYIAGLRIDLSPDCRSHTMSQALLERPATPQIKLTKLLQFKIKLLLIRLLLGPHHSNITWRNP